MGSNEKVERPSDRSGPAQLGGWETEASSSHGVCQQGSRQVNQCRVGEEETFS